MDKIWFERINNRDNVRLEIDKTGKFEISRGTNYASIRLTHNDIDRLILFLQNRNKNND